MDTETFEFPEPPVASPVASISGSAFELSITLKVYRNEVVETILTWVAVRVWL